jgi:hypothetical protein
VIRLYLATMFLIPVLDWFDRAFERYGVDIEVAGLLPDRVFVFGTIRHCSINGCSAHRRFFMLKLPVTTWGFSLNTLSMGWRRHSLLWIEGGEPRCGFRITPPLGD